MDTYTIQEAYPWQLNKSFNEISIKSENLIYTEIGHTHSGCQCNNLENNDEIHKKCRKIADLIREIEVLNTPIDINQQAN